MNNEKNYYNTFKENRFISILLKLFKTEILGT